MSRRLRFHAEARLELGEAIGYLPEKREGLGGELLDEIQGRLEDVDAKPSIATPVRDAPADLLAKRVLLRRLRDALILLWAEDALVVLARWRTRSASLATGTTGATNSEPSPSPSPSAGAQRALSSL